ncbi:MAG: T9SS type A sorting domain-containing protein [Flavobacteriales bacterium]|nr:T9SS type A sorting domain-containing protein [Flavobacteriales bacterium]MDG1780442.1 T9SS type A sorting domain-containing protein [Flavobacteriales bacterium]
MKSIFTLSTCFMCLLSFAQTKGTIESCEYDPINNRFFVSNSSSILVTDDLGETWSFFGDGSANYGMEVMGNNLFVIDNPSIYAYDLTTGEETMEMNVSGAQFLNGMGSDGNNTLYVSDFNGNKIYKIDVSDLDNPTSEVIVPNTSQPNGIVVDAANNRGIFVSWGENPDIKSFDLDTYDVTTLASGTGLSYCDGIDIDNDGNFYVSSWQPTRITKFNNDFSTDEIVSASGLNQPADISYGLEVDILGIANSGSGQVTFVTFGDNSIEDFAIDFSLEAFPVPATDHITFGFELETSAEVSGRIVDTQGKELIALEEAHMSAGKQTIELSSLSLATGVYFFELKINETLVVERFMID